MNPKKFCVITSGRTGSNYLASAFHSHPNIRIFGEIFNHHARMVEVLEKTGSLIPEGANPVEWLQNVIFDEGRVTQGIDNIGAIGFKLLYSQARQQNWNPVWKYIRSNADIIHLKRRNTLDMCISHHLANRDKKYVSFGKPDQEYEDRKIILEPFHTEWHMSAMQNLERQIDLFFFTSRKIEIFYEDLVADHRTMDRILEFLEVPVINLQSRTHRQRKKPKSEIVANWEKLKEFFEYTQFAPFFDDF